MEVEGRAPRTIGMLGQELGNGLEDRWVREDEVLQTLVVENLVEGEKFEVNLEPIVLNEAEVETRARSFGADRDPHSVGRVASIARTAAPRTSIEFLNGAHGGGGCRGGRICGR